MHTVLIKDFFKQISDELNKPESKESLKECLDPIIGLATQRLVSQLKPYILLLFLVFLLMTLSIIYSLISNFRK